MAYKMKGFSGFGNSPVKISDRDVVAAQAQLDKVETKFRQPGWAKAAYKAAHGWKKASLQGSEESAESATTADVPADKKTVSEIAAEKKLDSDNADDDANKITQENELFNE